VDDKRNFKMYVCLMLVKRKFWIYERTDDEESEVESEVDLKNLKISQTPQIEVVESEVHLKKLKKPQIENRKRKLNASFKALFNLTEPSTKMSKHSVD